MQFQLIAQIRPALILPYEASEYNSGLALYNSTSLFEIINATIPQIKQTTIESIPKTRVAVALGSYPVFGLILLFLK